MAVALACERRQIAGQPHLESQDFQLDVDLGQQDALLLRFAGVLRPYRATPARPGGGLDLHAKTIPMVTREVGDPAGEIVCQVVEVGDHLQLGRHSAPRKRRPGGAFGKRLPDPPGPRYQFGRRPRRRRHWDRVRTSGTTLGGSVKPPILGLPARQVRKCRQRTTRQPLLSLRLDGAFLLRFAARQFTG